MKSLTLLDRIVLDSVLPTEGNLKQLILIKDVRKKIALTQEELVKYELLIEGSSMKWNEEGATAKFDFEFTQLEETEIVNVLKKLDSENKITMQMIHICELFNMI